MEELPIVRFAPFPTIEHIFNKEWFLLPVVGLIYVECYQTWGSLVINIFLLCADLEGWWGSKPSLENVIKLKYSPSKFTEKDPPGKHIYPLNPPTNGYPPPLYEKVSGSAHACYVHVYLYLIIVYGDKYGDLESVFNLNSYVFGASAKKWYLFKVSDVQLTIKWARKKNKIIQWQMTYSCYNVIISVRGKS